VLRNKLKQTSDVPPDGNRSLLVTRWRSRRCTDKHPSTVTAPLFNREKKMPRHEFNDINLNDKEMLVLFPKGRQQLRTADAQLKRRGEESANLSGSGPVQRPPRPARGPC
jgi:hypothetical protein